MLSSVLWASVSSTGNQVVTFLIFVVVARLVTPDQLGLVALAGLIIELMQMVSNAGIADAVIQRRDLDERTADTAFWTNLAGGAVFAIFGFAMSGLLESLSGITGLGHVIRVLSVTFMIVPLGSVHSARLTRTFGFRALAVRNLGANLISGCIGIWIALIGGGVDALIAQRLSSVIATAAIGCLSFPWIPRPRFDRERCVELVRYGWKIMGSQFFQQINIRSVELIAGFVVGPAAVATIRVANRCIDMLIQVTVAQFAQVALPLLSRAQDDPGLLRRTYVNLSRFSAIAIYPAFAGGFALAPVIVPAVFGKQWEAAGDLMQIMCVVVIPLHFNVLMPATLAGSGHPGHVLGWSLAQLLMGIVLSVAGAHYGMVGLVSGNLLRSYLMLPVGIVLLRRATGIGVSVVFAGIARPIGAALLMTAMVSVARVVLTPLLPPGLLLGSCIALGVVSYGILSLMFMGVLLEQAAEFLPGHLGRGVRALRRFSPGLATNIAR